MTLTYDSTAQTLTVDLTFSGLSGLTTASHIHAPTAVAGAGNVGVATPTPTFPGFPLGVTSGSYLQSFDLTQVSSYNGAFVANNGGTAAGAEGVLVAALLAGKAYLNIHTTLVPGGEIRGFLTRVSNNVPEGGSTASMLLVALFGLSVFVPRRQRVNALP